MMRCILVGNYGVGNLGDEALKDYFLSSFPEIEWTVLSANPKEGELPRLPAGIRSFFTTQWGQTLKTMKSSDAVIFGGGTLFTDIESPLACVLWFLHARAAYFFGVPYFLAFQGVGPFRTGIGKILSRWVLQHAAFVSVRDEESARRVELISSNTKIVRTFDPVILSIQKENPDRAQKKIILIPRANTGQTFFDAIPPCLKAHPDADVFILLMQPDDERERMIAQKIAESVSPAAHSVGIRTLDALCAMLQGSLSVLTQRYHGALAALALGVPVQIVSQAAGDKLSELEQYAKNPSLFPGLLVRAKEGDTALRQALKI